MDTGANSGIVRFFDFSPEMPVLWQDTPELETRMTETKDTDLTVVVSELEPCRLKIDIEVPPERVRAAYEAVVKTFHGAAPIPGFRPGKSPRKLLERKFGPKIAEETVSRVVEASVSEAIESEGLRPETRPRVEDEQNLALPPPDQSLVFSITCDVGPTFTLPDYRNLTIQRRPTAVDDDAVENFVDNLLQQRATYEPVDRPAQEGDQLRVTYHAAVRGVDASDLPETARFLLDAEETWLPLREPEMLPGGNQQLIGCKAGDEVCAEIHFPDSFVASELAGQVADYTITIHEVQAQQALELTDDLAQSRFGVESADAVRLQVREMLEREDQSNRSRGLREDLVEKLLEGQDFAVPPGLLARESYDLFSTRLQQAYRRAPEQVQSEEFQKQLWEQVSQEATRNMRLQYILRRIADQEEIGMEQEEFDQYLGQMAKSYEMSPKVLQNRLRENNRLLDVFLDARQQKTLRHLLNIVTIEEPESQQEQDAS